MKAIAARRLARPGLEQLRDLVAEGQVDVVLVYAPDRLSRKYAYQVLLLEELGRLGVEVIFVRAPAGDRPLAFILRGTCTPYPWPALAGAFHLSPFMRSPPLHFEPQTGNAHGDADHAYQSGHQQHIHVGEAAIDLREPTLHLAAQLVESAVDPGKAHDHLLAQVTLSLFQIPQPGIQLLDHVTGSQFIGHIGVLLYANITHGGASTKLGPPAG